MSTTPIDHEELPFQKSFKLKAGDTLEWPVHLKIKAEAATTYSDLSLTGCTLSLYVTKGSTTVVNGTALTPDNAAQGKVTVRIPAATTAAWTGDYTWKLKIVFPTSHTNYPAGATRTWIEGSIKVRA